MMQIFPFSHWRAATRSPGHRAASAEDGFTLIEVMISALMVGLVAVATFNGFNTVNRASTNQREHDQAAVLAAQSQEELRSDSAETLDLLEASPHTYTQTVRNEVYTITQTAKWVNDSSQSTPCSATSKESSSNQNGNYVRVTSAVTWPQLGTGRPKVSQTSIVTPPDGSALEVDVTNGLTPLQPVAGATAIANGVQSVTGETGCVIFGAIPSTKVNVEVDKLGDVTHSGAFRKSAKELLIAPNLTTHYPVTLAPGGSVTAEFTYKGATEYEGKPVTGDAFVVFNNNVGESPEFEVGATKFTYEESGEAEGEYLPTPAKAGEYATTSTTPVLATHYPTGDLFPFENAWSVYAGDCTENLPTKFKGEAASAIVKPGENTRVRVPMSYVKPVLYEGTQTEPKAIVKSLKEKDEVKITNASCAAQATVSPNNDVGTVNLTTTQSMTESALLEAPFQPFGKYELCLYSAAVKKTYTVSYTNETAEGSKPSIYLGEKTESETRTKREAEEKETKTKREAEEKAKGVRSPPKETTAEREKRESAEAKEREEASKKEVKVEPEKKSC